MDSSGTPALVGSSEGLGPVAEALRLATTMMRDSWATGNDAAWQPAYQALETHLHGMLAAERERCAKLCNEYHKAAAYANALDSDMAAQPWQQVRDGKLWRGYVGTIYGCPVATDNGTTFDTAAAALANAEMFREQCREIRRKATGGATEHA